VNQAGFAAYPIPLCLPNAVHRRIILRTKIAKDDGIIVLPRSESHRIRNVLRLKKNDEISLVDSDGKTFSGEIIKISDSDGLIHIHVKPLSGSGSENQTSRSIVLMASVLKSSKYDTVIQKATELGVSKIVPLLTRRTVPRYIEEEKEKKRQRWERIAVEAARQCGRTGVPEISKPCSIEESFKFIEAESEKMVLHEAEKKNRFIDAIRSLNFSRKAFVVAVGPEGGFSKSDLNLFEKNGFIPVLLDPVILRAETASIVAVALLRYA
jgi:16S rRNA (uracil1498-N3)-methyltransferase